ncbi:cytochrome b [Marinomonas epiphytica]
MQFIKHFKNTEKQWGWLTITLHWLLAIVVIGLFALGWYMVDLSYYDPMYTLAPQIHEAIGLLVLILMTIRIVWRILSKTPKPPPSNSHFINKASSFAHKTLYILSFAILLSGLLISFAGGQGIDIFDWFNLPGPKDFIENQATYAGDIHYYAAYALMGLVILHTLAALKHHFIDKDTTLKNMLGLKEKP